MEKGEEEEIKVRRKEEKRAKEKERREGERTPVFFKIYLRVSSLMTGGGMSKSTVENDYLSV